MGNNRGKRGYIPNCLKEEIDYVKRNGNMRDSEAAAIIVNNSRQYREATKNLFTIPIPKKKKNGGVIF